MVRESYADIQYDVACRIPECSKEKLRSTPPCPVRASWCQTIRGKLAPGRPIGLLSARSPATKTAQCEAHSVNWNGAKAFPPCKLAACLPPFGLAESVPVARLSANPDLSIGLRGGYFWQLRSAGSLGQHKICYTILSTCQKHLLYSVST